MDHAVDVRRRRGRGVEHACPPGTPMTIALRFHGMSFRYAGSAEPALRDVTFDVHQGEVVALAGVPGSGTSTLLLVAGGYAPRLVGGALEGVREVDARMP